MLAAPSNHKPSKLPTILIAVAVASAVVYLAFFRHKEPAPAVAAAPAAAVASVRVETAPPVEPPKAEHPWAWKRP